MTTAGGSCSRPARAPRGALNRPGAGAPAAVGGLADRLHAARRLSATGLYAETRRRRDRSANRPFAPQYPLWSDGADKRRWVRLPDGAAIDTRNLNHWDFPVGTRFWKEFEFGGRKVETRMLVKNGGGSLGVRVLRVERDQSDAMLAPADGLPDVAEVAPGKRHSIPSREECRACHDSDGPVSGDASVVHSSSSVVSGSSSSVVSGFSRTQILGFSALQLSTDRDPGAPHAEPLADDMVTLSTLQDEGLFEPARPNSSPRRRASRRPTRARDQCSAICPRTAAAATTRTARLRIWDWR